MPIVGSMGVMGWRGVALNLVPHTHRWVFRMLASAGVDRLKIEPHKNPQIISPARCLVLSPQKHAAPSSGTTQVPSYLTQATARYHLKLQLTTIPVFSARQARQI